MGAGRLLGPRGLVILIAMVALLGGALLAARSIQTATSEASAAPTPKTIEPRGEPYECLGSNAQRCADALRGALQRTAGAKDSVLTTPLKQLAETSSLAAATGRSIAGPRSSSLPKASRDLIANRLLRIDEHGRVQVFAHANGDLNQAREAIRNAGGRVEREAVAQGIVQAWVPIAQLNALARSGRFESIRLPDYGFVATGSVTSQADALLGVAAARSTFGVDGSGVRVGVISDGMQGMIVSQGTGDLPSVNITTCNQVPQAANQSGAGSEGTAMLEIVHDLAPGAQLWFGHWGFGFSGTALDFMDAVNCLAQNVDVVIDDIYFLNSGPYDGSSAVSVNAAFALANPGNRIKGYYNAAGNSALEHYQGAYEDAGGSLAGFHVFRPVPFVTSDQFGLGPDVGNSVYLPNGEAVCVFLEWNDAWGASINDYDLYLASMQLLKQGQNPFVAQSIGAQNGTQNPTEALCYINTLNDGLFGVFIDRFQNEQVRTFDMFITCSLCAPLPDGDFGQPYFNFNTLCSSVPNNSDATAGVIASGAIEAADPGLDTREPYSSCGPTNDGRLKPELTALDGVAVTGNGGFGSPFYGTSAAAPHLGAIAALLLDCSPSLTETQLRNRLFNHADDLGAAGADNAFGYGRVDVAGSLTKGGCAPPPTATPTPTATRTPTLTPTSTITPTATPKNLAADTDGDTVMNDLDDNDDNDGCTDVQETGLVATAGGLRDPHNFWDFFDVPAGPSLLRDGSVSATDIFAVLGRFSSSGSSAIDPLSTPGPAPEYHTAYDRGAIVGANVWNLGPADGSIAATDIFGVLGQFNHSCA